MLSTSLIVFILGGVLQESRGRSLSMSVNLSLALNDEHNNSNQFSGEILRSCMKETEMSMAELARFRLGGFSNDQDIINGVQDTNEEKDRRNVDYDIQTIIEERNEESLQCFAHCLYEKLGLIKDGVFVDPDFFQKFYTVIEREKQPVNECKNLESENNCEYAYKIHLCYSKLKTLEAERRIREILDYGENGNLNYAYDSDSNNTTSELPDFDATDPKENEIEKNDIN